MIRCKFEDNGDALLRHVTVNVIARQKNSVLLVKRSLDILEGGKWCLPGGYLDRDETCSQAALRELYEETGYEGKVISLFTITDDPGRPKEDRQNVNFAFVVEVGQQTGQADAEQTEVRWFSLDELPADAEFAFDHKQIVTDLVSSQEKQANYPILKL